jgi:MOSC domain-containing protein YiiM
VAHAIEPAHYTTLRRIDFNRPRNRRRPACAKKFLSEHASRIAIFNAMEFKELFKQFRQSGVVEYISFRKKRAEPVEVVDLITAIAGKGLEGDRYKNAGGARQVTLIQGEHIDTIAAFLGKDKLDPAMLRRNIVVRGINLLALKEKQFQIGEAVLEHSGDCHPCSRMEETLGQGGYNAMRGLGGITARVISTGVIKVGDLVLPVEAL